MKKLFGRATLLVTLSSLVVVAACGESKPRRSTKPGTTPVSSGGGGAAANDEPEEAAGGGSRRSGRSGAKGKVTVVKEGDAESPAPGRITGVALFSGTPPARDTIKPIQSTTGCSEHHVTAPLTETVIVNGGKLKNAFVYISRGLSDWEPTPVPDDPLILDQLGCLYTPHVSGIRAGRKLHARNSDDLSHNVHVIATKNENPNKTQGAGAAPLEIRFEAEEIPIKFVCDIHPWMRAYVCVVEHPFFAVTGADGSFSIDDVPPGKYTLTAWHEKLRKVKAELTVGGGGEVAVEFPFSE